MGNQEDINCKLERLLCKYNIEAEVDSDKQWYGPYKLYDYHFYFECPDDLVKEFKIFDDMDGVDYEEDCKVSPFTNGRV